MSQLISHTDGECEDPHCPLHSKREFQPKNGTGPKACTECGFSPIRMIGALCEPCYRKVELAPAVAHLDKVRLDYDAAYTELIEKLSHLTNSSANDNFNMRIECRCGKIYNSAIAMFKHSPDCTGPAPKTVHRTVTGRAVKIDLKNFSIG